MLRIINSSQNLPLFKTSSSFSTMKKYSGWLPDHQKLVSFYLIEKSRTYHCCTCSAEHSIGHSSGDLSPHNFDSQEVPFNPISVNPEKPHHRHWNPLIIKDLNNFWYIKHQILSRIYSEAYLKHNWIKCIQLL